MKYKRRRKKKIPFFQITTYTITLFIGIALGIYILPILIAPVTPNSNEFKKVFNDAEYEAVLVKDLEGSDFLHWGKGQLTLTKTKVAFRGKLSPGPDYKLYLTKTFVQTKQDFLQIKDQSMLVGEIKTFDGFIISTTNVMNLSAYNSVVIWCETFSKFISSAKYQ